MVGAGAELESPDRGLLELSAECCCCWKRCKRFQWLQYEGINRSPDIERAPDLSGAVSYDIVNVIVVVASLYLILISRILLSGISSSSIIVFTLNLQSPRITYVSSFFSWLRL